MTNHWQDALAGGVAGLGSRMATAPLDLLRIRRQLNVVKSNESILQTWRYIVQQEGGVTALYRGNLAAIYLWVSYAAVQFSIYQSIEASPFVAGAVAGTGATLMTYPLDVMRTTFAARGVATRMPLSSMMDPQPYHRVVPTSLWQFVKGLYKTKGIMGFYAGAFPAILVIIPYMGLNFSVYELIRDSSKDPVLSLYAGSLAGAFSKSVVYPLDTLKRRLMAQAYYSRHQHSAWACFSEILHNEGVYAFYRGLFPSVLKTTLASGISFGLFRFTKNTLEGMDD